MPDPDKLAILTFINSQASIGVPARLSFNALGKTVSLPKQSLDLLLTELNKERFITQYAKKGVDGFTVQITQKGLDAVTDGSDS
jgi:hypothetical protein